VDPDSPEDLKGIRIVSSYYLFVAASNRIIDMVLDPSSQSSTRYLLPRDNHAFAWSRGNCSAQPARPEGTL